MISRLCIATFLVFCCLGMAEPSKIAEPLNIANSASENSIVICLQAGVQTFDPTNYRSRTTQLVLKNMFDSLTTRTIENKVIPQLAKSWQLIDQTLWQFVLRKGVRFHNGEYFTATDVKFTIDRVIQEGAIDGRTSSRRSLFKPIAEVNVVDDHTVHFKTHHPWPNLPLLLSMQEILPASYMKTIGTRGFDDHPVGTGPFKLLRTLPGKEIVLERFNDYYGGAPGRPPIQTAPLKQVIFKIIPSHLDMLAMLKTGHSDLISNVQPGSIPILKMLPGIHISKVRATRSYFAEINCTKPPLADMRVRRAFNYAVNVNAMLNQKMHGHGETLATVLLPNAFGFNPELDPYPYDPPGARSLLDEVQFPDNRTIAIYSNSADLIFADAIALYLTKMGIQTRMVISPDFRPKTTGPDAPWDIFVGSWGNSTLDPVGILLPKFGTAGRGNFSGYSSAAFDRLMNQAQFSMSDALRLDYYRQIQNILFDDAPVIFGYALNEYYAVAERVKNFTPSATGMIDLHDVYIDGAE